MRPLSVALLVAGVAGAGAGVYFLIIRPRQLAAAAAGAKGTGVAVDAKAVKAPVIEGVNVNTLLTGDHVARRDTLAPRIISGVTGGLIPTNVAQPIANIAGKLSLSGYAERYISTKVPIVGKVAEAPVSIAKGAVSVGSSVIKSIGGLF